MWCWPGSVKTQPDYRTDRNDENWARDVGVGPVRVDPFRYQPHHDEKGKLEANQIENTAIGSIYITQDVSGFVRDAVKMELHFMGYDYSESSFRAIRGNVKRFVADDLGYSIDWRLEAEFVTISSHVGDSSGNARGVTDLRHRCTLTGT